MCNQDDATVKLILRGSKHEVSICKVKTGKWNEETFYVFFQHISFILAKSYYRLLYSEFQPERNKIGWGTWPAKPYKNFYRVMCFDQ